MQARDCLNCNLDRRLSLFSDSGERLYCLLSIKILFIFKENRKKKLLWTLVSMQLNQIYCFHFVGIFFTFLKYLILGLFVLC